VEHEIYKVLFLCSGNSGRSIIAESLLNHLGGGRFRAFSAGSYPVGRINALTLDLLSSRGHPVDSLSSKSWIPFFGQDAPQFDFVITVSTQVAAEVQMPWNGNPIIRHWDLPAPGQVTGSDREIRAAFVHVYDLATAKVTQFIDEIGEGRAPSRFG
jgi:arsenate reductase